MEQKNWPVTSPLMRHEISFILGQVYEKEDFVRKTLREVALNEEEISVVRHEAILSYYDCDKDQELM